MILILGGTSETHNFIANEKLDKDFIITVSTDYGYSLYSRLYGSKVLKINFSKDLLKDFVNKNNITKIIDTTHPNALTITKIAKTVAVDVGIDYIYAKRDIDYPSLLELARDSKNIFIFDSVVAAKDFLKKNSFKRILFTIGVKYLYLFREFLENSYVRILPSISSIKKAQELGVLQSNIIAMQGPFTKELNFAIINQYKIDCIISKISGKNSGLYEKIEATIEKNITIVLFNNNSFKF
ncbi:MAG: precorrin-6A reductase [Deferribacterota bacterium]|nr:precorrin-6A reductase [Deferribacterota bacterium]